MRGSDMLKVVDAHYIKYNFFFLENNPKACFVNQFDL
jgi:hypothetical protein